MKNISHALLVMSGLFALIIGAPISAEADAPQGCAYVSGPGEFQIVDAFAYPPVCGGTVLRVGTTAYGEVHISTSGPNHELTDFAKARWQDALNSPPVANPSPGYFVHSIGYLTPEGAQRTMCVFVDTKTYSGIAHRGIVTAFWKPGLASCT